MTQLDSIQESLAQLTAEAISLRADLVAQTTQIQAQTEQIQAQTTQIQARTRQLRALKWALVASLVVGALALAAVIVATVDNTRRLDASNQRWCPMVSLLIPQPGDAPPVTERGRQMAVNARGLYRGFNCTD